MANSVDHAGFTVPPPLKDAIAPTDRIDSVDPGQQAVFYLLAHRACGAETGSIACGFPAMLYCWHTMLLELT